MLVLMTLGLGACNDELAQPPVIIPEGGIGTGAWDNPMTVYQVGLGSVNNAFESCWVKGYIVGYVNIDVANVLKDETAVFTTPATVKTNILLAATADEKDWTKCIPVQLPSGPVRNALNVADHADNMGKEVCILGSTGSKYCSAYGLRSASAYKWGDKGDESIDNKKPETPVVTGQTIYSALDASDSSLDPEWTIENVSLATGLNYVWSWKDYNGQYYLNASAYAQNKANAALAYCYSPVISLALLRQLSVSNMPQNFRPLSRNFARLWFVPRARPNGPILKFLHGLEPQAGHLSTVERLISRLMLARKCRSVSNMSLQTLEPTHGKSRT